MKVIFFKASPFLGNKSLEKGLSRVNLLMKELIVVLTPPSPSPLRGRTINPLSF
jgi:hypothetical protein